MGRFGNVSEGLGGYGRVWEVWKGLGGFGMIWDGLRGVWEGLDGRVW